MDIDRLITHIADDLGIEPPAWKLVPRLNTDTQIGAVDPDTLTLYIKRGLADPDAAFTAAHELRHLWQIKNGYRATEHTAAGSTDTASYNEQEAEIDAHAYAASFMRRTFGIMPLFNGLPEDIKQQIITRSREIDNTL